MDLPAQSHSQSHDVLAHQGRGRSEMGRVVQKYDIINWCH